MRQLKIPRHIFEEMLAHCNATAPNEACGILAGERGAVRKIYSMSNNENSPVSYHMDSGEQFRVMKEMRQEGLSMLAIFHSHPASQAYPSAKDVNLAFYEEAVYVIVSLAGAVPEAKAFRISQGEVRETGFVILEQSPEGP